MKKIIITFLALVLALGVAFSITDIVGYMSRNKIENNPIINPYEEAYTELSSYDFNEVVYLGYDEDYTYFEDFKVYYGDNGYFTGSVDERAENPYFYMQYWGADDHDYSVRYDNYAFIGETKNINDGYNCVVIDVDVKLEDWVSGASVGIRPSYRNSSNKLAHYDGTLLRFYSGGLFKNVKGGLIAENIPDEFHYTYILWADGRADIYINGNYTYTIAKAYNDDCAYFDGIRVSCTYNNVTDGAPTVQLDNLKIKTYNEGYEGEILDLYEHPDVNLADMACTVLGGGY